MQNRVRIALQSEPGLSSNYLPLQQSDVQPPWQQEAPHLSSQQVVQPALDFGLEVWANAATARTRLNESNANVRFMDISLTWNLNVKLRFRCQARDTRPRAASLASTSEGLNPKYPMQDVARRRTLGSGIGKNTDRHCARTEDHQGGGRRRYRRMAFGPRKRNPDLARCQWRVVAAIRGTIAGGDRVRHRAFWPHLAHGHGTARFRAAGQGGKCRLYRKHTGDKYCDSLEKPLHLLDR